MEIQKARFGDQFIFYYEVEEGLEDFPVFRLMLQPLVENSILHGIRYRTGRGYVKLKALKRKGRVRFSVIDTGVGMTKDALRALMNTIQDYDSRSIGLSNVNCRLKLYYGKGSGITVLSKRGMETVVEFSVPYREEKQ